MMRDRSKRLIIIISLALSLLIVSGALLLAVNRKKAAQSDPGVLPKHTVSLVELKAADGRDGRACLVVVDGVAYQIKDFSLWQDGKHLSSNRQAYCGADLSKVIDKAPHGRKMLDLLIKIGPFKG